MSHDTRLLHHLRSQQLQALVKHRDALSWSDQSFLLHWMAQTGGTYDTSSLSDKALEMIDTMALRYLER